MTLALDVVWVFVRRTDTEITRIISIFWGVDLILTRTDATPFQKVSIQVVKEPDPKSSL